jgi:hypothetical protein
VRAQPQPKESRLWGASPNRYGSKTLDGQQNECMFRLLNNRLDPAQPPSYDPPVLRMTVLHIEHIPSFRSKGARHL